MATETKIPEKIVLRPAGKLTPEEVQQIVDEHRELLDLLAKNDGPVEKPRP